MTRTCRRTGRLIVAIRFCLLKDVPVTSDLVEHVATQETMRSCSVTWTSGSGDDRRHVFSHTLLGDDL